MKQRWMRAVVGLQAGTLALASASALAQATPPTPPATPSEVVVTTATVDTPRDADQLYDAAFAALATGDRALAARYLQTIVLSHPGHARFPQAQALLQSLAVEGAGSVMAPSPDDETRRTMGAIDVGEQGWAPAHTGDGEVVPDHGTAAAPSSPDAGEPEVERATAGARAELIFFQTLHGMALGLELCALWECDEARPWVATTMLGGGLGFAASYIASDGGITPGLSRALTDGVLWGAAHGLEVYAGAELWRGSGEDQRLATSLILGQLAGMGVAGGLYHWLQPTTGQVSLTSSGGIWAAVLTGQMLGVLQPRSSSGTLGWLMMATTDLGLLGGGLLASHQRMSASRVLMIDAGGLLGTLLGMGAGVLVGTEAEVIFGLGALGTVSGLGLAYHLTSVWDVDDTHDDDTTAQLHVAPQRDGATVMLSGRW